MLRFLFGHGWVTAWILLMYLLCAGIPAHYWRELKEWTVEKKGDPAGALGVFGVCLLMGMFLAFFSVVNAIVYFVKMPAPPSTRLLHCGTAAGVATVAYIAITVMLSDRNAFAFYAFYAFLAALILLNLWALYAVGEQA